VGWFWVNNAESLVIEMPRECVLVIAIWGVVSLDVGLLTGSVQFEGFLCESFKHGGGGVSFFSCPVLVFTPF
jgi:hypothetical protein